MYIQHWEGWEAVIYLTHVSGTTRESVPHVDILLSWVVAIFEYLPTMEVSYTN